MLDSLQDRPSITCLLFYQLATLLVSISMGMNAIMFPVTMESKDYSEAVMGLALAGETISLLLVCFTLQWFLRKFGLVIILMAALLLRAASLYFVLESGHWAEWLGYIFVHGLGAYVMVLLLQILITSMPFKQHSTLVNAMYGVMISLGYSIGPFMVDFASNISNGQLENILGQFVPIRHVGVSLSIIFSMLAGLVLLFSAKSPLADEVASRGLISIIKTSPGVYWAIAYCGLVLFGITAFITIYGIRNDMEIYTASMLLVAFVSGCIVLEPVYAWISRHFELRHFLFSNIFVSLLFSAFLPLVIYDFYQSIVLLFLWGGANASCYSVAITILSTRFKAGELVAANAAFSLMDSVGGTIGIVLIGVCMNHFGSEGLAYVIMLASVLYFSYGLTRYKVV